MAISKIILVFGFVQLGWDLKGTFTVDYIGPQKS